MLIRPAPNAGLLAAAGGLVLLGAVATLFAGQTPHRALAQDAAQAPPRAAEAVNALNDAVWRKLESGIEAMEISSALGTRLVALRFSDAEFRYSVIQQEDERGITANAGARTAEAIVAVNGGFFAARSDGRLYPVGMLIDDGQVQSPAWSESGGFLAVTAEGRAQVTVSANGMPETAHEAIQSRPVILEPGGLWAMRTNTNDPKRRTIFCRLDDTRSMLLVISGQGLSLYEAGWLLRSKAWGGFFGCYSAIALDGGSSTQLYVRGEKDMRVDALGPVQNLLVVHPRAVESQ